MKDAKFTRRELDVMRCVAYGASTKEVPDLVLPGPHGKISESCVAHVIERVKAKVGVQKVTEIAAYYFCHYRGADASDCPTSIKSILLAGTMLLAMVPSMFMCDDYCCVRPSRAASRIVRTARARRIDFEPEIA
jgi:DNA-binding CsgD family transcriptional regulator